MTNRTDTDLLIDNIVDRLDDLHIQQEISYQMYQKKKDPAYLLAMLNAADIAVCAELRVSESVAIYVEKGMSMVPLVSLKQYEIFNELTKDSDIFKTEPLFGALLLNNRTWVDVSAIKGSSFFVYPEAFPKGRGNALTYRLVSFDELNRDYGGHVAFLDNRKKALLFRVPFAEARYLHFEALLRPAVVGKDTEPEDYRLVSPDYAYSYVLTEALRNILPARLFRGLGIANEHAENRMEVLSRAPGSAVTTTTSAGEYGW